MGILSNLINIATGYYTHCSLFNNCNCPYNLTQNYNTDFFNEVERECYLEYDEGRPVFLVFIVTVILYSK